MEQVYIMIATTSDIHDKPDFGISDLGQVYKNKEEAIDTVTNCYGYKQVEGQQDVFEKFSDGGKFRHRYKIVAKYIW